jgi:hypothetical protein
VQAGFFIVADDMEPRLHTHPNSKVAGLLFGLNLPKIKRIKCLWFMIMGFGKVNRLWEMPIDTSTIKYL